jgi:16S rRNA processing protein RimM
MPASDDGRWYWMDLIGLQVVTTGGVALGQVSGLLETGANDVLVVQGDRERLVPFVMDQYVKRVDLDAAVIEVDWDPEF